MPSTAKWHTLGKRWLMQVLNKSQTLPTNLFLGLRTLDGVGSHPGDVANGDSLGNATTLAEVSTSGTGYARISVTLNATNFPEALAANSIDSIITALVQQFNFTASVTGITHAFLATSADNSGVMLCSAPLSATRNVANGDQINDTFTMSATG